MSSPVREEINFWPGYVDALINVLLNLLFLVGIFTVGLLVLNAEVAIVQKEAARQKISQVLSSSPVSERQKKVQQMLNELPPPVQAMPAQALPVPVQQEQATVASEAPGLTREIRIRRRVQLNESTRESAAESKQAVVQDDAPELALGRLTGGKVAAKLVFELDQFAPAPQTVLPADIRADSDRQWLLVVLSEPDNPRLAREAFARLMSVRNLMLQSGIAARQIQIKVRPRPATAAWPADVEQTVFIVAVPQ